MPCPNCELNPDAAQAGSSKELEEVPEQDNKNVLEQQQIDPEPRPHTRSSTAGPASPRAATDADGAASTSTSHNLQSKSGGPPSPGCGTSAQSAPAAPGQAGPSALASRKRPLRQSEELDSTRKSLRGSSGAKISRPKRPKM